ncbi:MULTISPECIES: hypothetical protein [Frankia]|nr:MULTISPECIES: hypothetical protein [Frankia]
MGLLVAADGLEGVTEQDQRSGVVDVAGLADRLAGQRARGGA